ncbi:pistil-specific extensin-like protein [Eucalyptus grandis]|uniref:pistil-specific extensin-like protein n=1 Tax=Eucalyptus grandis TaxID=71139 RepID=UPI00192F022D|nr:pistil-specific extensin-like protein [Eucalyptus grandis]
MASKTVLLVLGLLLPLITTRVSSADNEEKLILKALYAKIPTPAPVKAPAPATVPVKAPPTPAPVTKTPPPLPPVTKPPLLCLPSLSPLPPPLPSCR